MDSHVMVGDVMDKKIFLGAELSSFHQLMIVGFVDK